MGGMAWRNRRCNSLGRFFSSPGHALLPDSYVVLTLARENQRMRGVNNVILIGNATRDAELHHTQTGKAVSSIRLATNRQVKGRGSPADRTRARQQPHCLFQRAAHPLRCVTVLRRRAISSMTRTPAPPPLLVSDHGSGGSLGGRRSATLPRLLDQGRGKAIERTALTVRVHGLVCCTQRFHGLPGRIIVKSRLWVCGEKRGLRPRLGGCFGVSGRYGEWRHRGPRGCW